MATTDDIAFGWYGKRPSTGDFVSRRLPKALVDRLDLWLQAGMTALRERAPDAWQGRYAAAPVWNALIPSRILAPDACLAVVAASHDRVGRRFPMCVIVQLPGGRGALSRIASLPAYCAGLAALVDGAIRSPVGADDLDRQLSTLTAQFVRGEEAPVDDLSDIAAVLGDAAIDNDLATVPLGADSAFPWPDLARVFEPGGTTSYWWSAARPGRVQSGFTHAGALDAALFLTLFGDARDAHAGSGTPD
ncbi:MAG: type VI secretion system-associated protein TagF [Rudaea sp.]